MVVHSIVCIWATLWNQFSPSTFLCVLEGKLRLTGLVRTLPAEPFHWPLNLWFSCLYLPSARIISRCHHTWITWCFGFMLASQALNQLSSISLPQEKCFLTIIFRDKFLKCRLSQSVALNVENWGNWLCVLSKYHLVSFHYIQRIKWIRKSEPGVVVYSTQEIEAQELWIQGLPDKTVQNSKSNKIIMISQAGGLCP